MNIKAKLLNLFLRFLYVLPVSKNKICFLCFDGSKIGFDSKAVAEWITENNKNYNMVWLVKDRECQHSFKFPGVKFSVYKSLSGIIQLMTSGIIVYNISVPPHVPFRDCQILVNTWHGMPYKIVGKTLPGFSVSSFNKATVVPSHSKMYSERVLLESFEYKGKILECGAPRNDVFFSNTKIVKTRKIINEKYKLINKNIALYAPTFRGDFQNEVSSIDLQRLLKDLELKFGGEWVLFYRVHPLLSSKFSSLEKNIIDVSAHHDMQELLCCADILITDYSSSMWDYCLTKKPVLLYVDDVEEYRTTGRGLYEPLEQTPFLIAHNNDEMDKQIAEFNYDLYRDAVDKYLDNCGSFENGKSVQSIFEFIEGEVSE